MAVTFHSLHVATVTTFRSLSSTATSLSRAAASSSRSLATSFRIIRSLSADANQAAAAVLKSPEKPPICTADELHYVSVSNSTWRLALWRYHPSPQAPPRSHPLLLLSGVGTNAIGYDLSPESSFARYMSGQGFDTWILEVRGAGLSVEGTNSEDIEQSANALSKKIEGAAASASASVSSADEQSSKTPSGLAESDATALATPGVSSAEKQSSNNNPTASAEIDVYAVKPDSTTMATVWDKSSIATKLTETFLRVSERFSSIPNEDQSNNVSAKLFDWQERLTSIIEDIQKQLDLIVKYDWDFDHYLEEDVPAAMEYVRAQCKPKDGKLMAIGHSMGGILLYSMLSRCGHEGRDPKLAAIVTLASSLDYTSSKSRLKLLLPFANPAQAFNVPAVPLGTLLAAAYPLSFPWVLSLISAENMMHPELLEKLILNNFCTIPAKLLLQLRTAFQKGGLCDRSGTFFYKNHLHKSSVPVLALAGDQDLICPPEAVEETVKLIPEHLVTCEVFGEPGGAHFAHYDLVGGRLAVERVYPRIIQFLSQHDSK